MKIVQLNLNHCQAAQDLLLRSAQEESADLVLVSEPYSKRNEAVWLEDREGGAAIWLCGAFGFQDAGTRAANFVRAKVNGIHFFSCYARPSMSIMEFGAFLDDLVAEARGKSPVVIAGDFNAWSTTWGSRCSNQRGDLLLEAFAGLNISLLNRGNATTYRKAGRESIIDIAFASSYIAQRIHWTVSESYTHSDHQAILMDIKIRRSLGQQAITGPKWKDKMLDEQMFVEMFRYQELGVGSAEDMAGSIVSMLVKACDASMPRRIQRTQRPVCHWWNTELTELRSICLRARRRMQRSRNRDSFQDRLNEFKASRLRLQKAIKAAKRDSFKKLLDEADVDPWGTAYKAVMTKIKGVKVSQPTCPVLLRNIVCELFPTVMEIECLENEPAQTENIPRITPDELRQACAKIKNGKTPGPDGIPNKVLKLAMEKFPEIFLQVFNQCLQEGVFPKAWRKQWLVLIPKAGKPPGLPSSYRPICLLDTIGKTLEKIVCNRLQQLADENGALSANQFGFRKGRSTVDAIIKVVNIAREAIQGERWRWGDKEYCAIVTLDVKNAFNTANWMHVKGAVSRTRAPPYVKKMVHSYLSERSLEYNSDEGVKTHVVTAGVPQGSVLGPLLWNLMYDQIFRLCLPDNCVSVGFADDFCLVVRGKEIGEIERTICIAIKVIMTWLKSAKLSLAEQKTEVVLVTSRKKMEFCTIQVGDHRIRSKEAVKYLGVMIDNRLSFKAHLHHIKEKASKVQNVLSWILPNVGGPQAGRRKLITTVVTSVLMYAAPVWADAVRMPTYLKIISSVYRLSALRAISGFRTISNDAALVLAEMLPVDILAREMKRLHEFRSRTGRRLNAAQRERERQISISLWQRRWREAESGRWTFRLVPDIQKWMSRRHGVTNYQLTQFLSGHGGYRWYLHRFGHDDSPLCPICDETEDAEHVIFHCRRFPVLANGPLQPEQVLDFICESMDNWRAFCEHVSRVQIELRRIERERRSNQTS